MRGQAAPRAGRAPLGQDGDGGLGQEVSQAEKQEAQAQAQARRDSRRRKKSPKAARSRVAPAGTAGGRTGQAGTEGPALSERERLLCNCPNTAASSVVWLNKEAFYFF